MTHATCRLTAKNRDQLRDPTLGNRVWATFTFFTTVCRPTLWPADAEVDADLGSPAGESAVHTRAIKAGAVCT